MICAIYAYSLFSIGEYKCKIRNYFKMKNAVKFEFIQSSMSLTQINYLSLQPFITHRILIIYYMTIKVNISVCYNFFSHCTLPYVHFHFYILKNI